MIVLDTHVWVWWAHGSSDLPADYCAYLHQQQATGLGVSVISCWAVAKLVERGRLQLPRPLPEWMDSALSSPGIRLLSLTPDIAIESTALPGSFHRDPADQIIVATARLVGSPVVSLDAQILVT